jgi:hypothetical protein
VKSLLLFSLFLSSISTFALSPNDIQLTPKKDLIKNFKSLSKETNLKRKIRGSSSDIFGLDFSKKIRQLGPGNRPCCAFGVDLQFIIKPIKLNQITELSELNSHYYGNNLLKEKNGEVYTCKGGFIDTGHLRHNADWTIYFAYLVEKLMHSGGTVKLKNEGGKRWFTLKKQETPFTKEQIIKIAQRITYNTSVWHEVLTWFVPAAVPIYSEKPSTFAPEDNYSNLLGTYVAADVLSRSGNYSELTVESIQRALTDLDALDIQGTRQAFFHTENTWWHRKEKSLKKHTFSYEGGKVTPWVIKDFSKTKCNKSDNIVSSLSIPESIVVDGKKVSIDSLYELNIIAKKAIPIQSLLGRSNNYVNQHDLKKLVKKVRSLIKEEFEERGVGNPLHLDQ